MRRLSLLLLAALALSCGPKTPPTPPDPDLNHIGVWHGTGLAFPAGELCLVFCPNKKLFAANTDCRDLGHSDFERAWTWSRTPDGLLVAHTPDGDLPIRFRPHSPSEALFDLVSHPGLPMSRIGLVSPVCLES